jgi:hypothetical protein
MKPSRILLAALPAALLAACGGQNELTSATPAYQALSMDLTKGDAATPVADGAVAPSGAALTMVDDPCHPHLFIRTHDVVARVNRHLWHFLRHAEDVFAKDPTTTTGSSQVWERVKDGIDVRFTVTHTTGQVFTWTLELMKVGDAAFTTVFSGTIDRTNATGPHQGVGDATLDLGKLASVTGQDVAGVLTLHFETFAGSRQVVVDAKDVVWDTDANADFLRQPRNAHYVYLREPGKGGSLKVEEQMVFLCPSNPSLLSADVKLASRWYRTTAGALHGRSDALMTGGQLPADAIDHVVGVTCHAGDADGDDQAESFWLMKAEDAAGATIQGASHVSQDATASACDPLLNPPSGTVPDLSGPANDFSMSGIDFTDATPYPFPGM